MVNKKLLAVFLFGLAVVAVSAGPVEAATRSVIPKTLRPAYAIAPGDELPEDVVAPGSPRPLRTIVPDPCDPATFDALDAAGGDWAMYATNETGAYAWQEAYVLRAYLAMYRATGDTRYLDKFVLHANAVVARTDKARGVPDYRGRSLPAWRTGGSYTYAVRYLNDWRGKAVIRVLANRDRNNNETRVIVTSTRRGTVFTLGARNKRLNIWETYRGLSMNPRSRNYVARRVNSVSRLIQVSRMRRARALPNPIPRRTAHSLAARPLPVLFAVHTALVTYPLAQFARMVGEDPALKGSYEETASRFLAAAVRAVAVHDGDWRSSGAYGYYVFPRGAPIWSDGVVLPHNQNLAMGRTFLELYAATGVHAYLERAERLAVMFKAHLRRDVSGAYVWDYWWGPGYSGWNAARSPSLNTRVYRGYRALEDISHGAISSDFASLAATRTTSMDATDQIGFANTFHANMTRADGELAWTVSGQGLAGGWGACSGEWLGLAGVSRNVFLTTKRVLAGLINGPAQRARRLCSVALACETQRLMDAEPRPMLAPTVTVTGTIPASPVAGDVRVSVDVEGDATPAVSFFVDGRRSGATMGPPHQFVWPGASLKDGSHVFGAVATDADGRSHAVRFRTRVDRTPPAISVISANPTVLSSDGDGYADWIVFALRSSEYASVRFSLQEARTGKWIAPPRADFNLPSGTSRWAWNGRSASGASAPEGWYRLVAVATDRLGNTGRSTLHGFALNKTLHGVEARGYFTRWGDSRARILYRLRHRARVWMYVYRGRVVVRRLMAGAWRPTGRGAVVWDGLDAHGEAAAPGRYRVDVLAGNRLGTMTVSKALLLR